MKRCKYSSRHVASVATAAAVVVAGSVFAQTATVDQVLQADLRRLELAQESQERINQVVEGTRSLADDYRAINKEIDGLQVYNRLMTAQTNGQQATLDDIALSLEQVDNINRQIFPLMERMIDGVEQSIALDIPFLLTERTNRVDALKDIMERSDVSVAEKFRKVMEAYQIEMDYGTSGEWYREELNVDGSVREYNMLRVGRIGLYFQSDDTNISGWYNPDSRQYELLGTEHRNEIRKGIRIARQLIAPELMLLPIPAAEAAGGA
ncbi:MAG: DUF3450 domain-containing protein [Gammaproteobacteria bacterium]|nr:DUF3450 domain-containing protein [Gammaproteobacteria bacterium]